MGGVQTILGVARMKVVDDVPTCGDAPDWHWLPTPTGYGITPFTNPKPTQQKIYHGGKSWSHGKAEPKIFNINFQTKPDVDTLLMLFRAMGLSGSVSGEAAPYVHTLNSEDGDPYYLEFIDAYGQGDQVWKYHTGLIQSIALTMNNGEPVLVNVTAVAVRDKYTGLTKPTVVHPDYDDILMVSKGQSRQAVHNFVYGSGQNQVSIPISAKSNTASFNVSRSVVTLEPSWDDEVDVPTPAYGPDFTYALTADFNHGYLNSRNVYKPMLSLLMGGDGVTIPDKGARGKIGTHTLKVLGGIIANTDRYYMQVSGEAQCGHDGYTNDNTKSNLSFDYQTTPEIKFQGATEEFPEPDQEEPGP